MAASTFWGVCAYILLTELCERLAYYGLTGSLTIFLNDRLGFDASSATEINALFGSVVYVTPVLGAFVADAYWGRYKTILFFCSWYTIGMVLCTVGGFPHLPSGFRAALFLFGLFSGVAVGAGGIKSNVVVLGADQFDLPQQKAEQDAFFNWFYWAINLGAAFALGFLPIVASKGLFVPRDYGFFVSYLIPAVAFVVGLLVFAWGSPRYKMKPPQGSALHDFFSTMGAALKRGGGRAKLLSIGTASLPLGFILVTCSVFILDATLKQAIAIVGMTVIFGALPLISLAGKSVSWMVPAKRTDQEGGEEAAVELASSLKDAMDVIRVLPLACCCVVFWAVYSQMTGNFQLQGCQMDCRLFGGELPPPVLNVFDSAVSRGRHFFEFCLHFCPAALQISLAAITSRVQIIMVLVPLVDKIVYPFLHRIGCPLGLLTKIGLGFFFAGCSMVCAALVELARKSSPIINPITPDLYSPCSNHASGKSVLMNDLPIWWQIPQYGFIGLGEIFAAISSYELFYSQVPDAMRSVCQSINLLCVAFGSLAVAGLNAAMSSWITDNLNDGHLELVFLVLTAIMAINILAFLYLSRGFQYRMQQSSNDDDAISQPRDQQREPLSDRLLSPQQPISTDQ